MKCPNAEASGGPSKAWRNRPERTAGSVRRAVRGAALGRIPQAAVASTWRTADGALAFADWRDYSPQVET